MSQSLRTPGRVAIRAVAAASLFANKPLAQQPDESAETATAPDGKAAGAVSPKPAKAQPKR